MQNEFKALIGFVLVCIFSSPIQVFSVDDELSKANPRPDLALISGQKFQLLINNESYDIYYGIILGESSVQDYDGKITFMSIMPEKKSLVINFDNILQTDNVWIRFPNDVISADNERFVLLVDGIEKGYELSSHGTETRLGFVINKGTNQVEIIGNNVIPEFPSNLLLISLIVFCLIISISRITFKMY